ncbi:MAG: amino acid permease [Planctomycetota bacterium]|nr:MAG: amino acid permease [Planctomycetota bacterium]
MPDDTSTPHLERGLNLVHATSLNVANMLGAGPFITIPVLLAAMGGPQAMLGWFVAMVVVMCDGLIWAELGAALPGSGGTYHYFREIYKGTEWGKLLPFLFIWQFLVSGTLEVASGYIGAANFALSLAPGVREMAGGQWGWSARVIEGLPASIMVAVIFLLLCQHIRSLGWLSTVLVAGVLAAVGTVIVLGMMNFRAELILPFPENAFRVDRSFLLGLGAAMQVAVYDYLGYYNICHLGEEVYKPEKTIPRAVLLSIVIVATIYVLMNLSFIGVVPWQEAVSEGTMANRNIAGAFMTRLYGEQAASLFTGLIIWTCLAGLFAMTLGYSRILYAAAANGDFFTAFAALHPTRGFPWAALGLISVLTAFFCFFPLEIVITGAVTLRIVIQFIGQIFALHALRRQATTPLPFRMWLYPAPSVIALVGWLFLLFTSDAKVLLLLAGVYAAGVVAYLVRKRVALRAG